MLFPDPLPLISFEKIMQEPLPPVDWVIEPLISQGSRVMVYGEFGSLKTWLLLTLGLHVAAERPWLGQFPVPKARSVLYIDEEMNERTLRRRIKRLGLDFENGALPFQALSRVGVRFDSGGADRLLAALAKSEFEPEIVIVEAFRRVLVGSENEAKDVSAFWRYVEPILKAGKTLIISHHMKKPPMEGKHLSRHRASGSTDILAGADTGFALERKSQDSIIIENVKSRESEEYSPFVVTMYDEGEDGSVGMRYEGSPEEFRAEGSKLSLVMNLVVELLSSTPENKARTSVIIAYIEARGFAERTAHRALKELRKRGRACTVQRGWWQLVK